jgi:7-cyano-7-deazaguanine synthase
LELKTKCLKRAVISLSGGMDSTCLLVKIIGSKDYDEIHCISFNYGQKHKEEIQYAKKSVEFLKSKFKEINFVHKIMDLKSVFLSFDSSLLEENETPVPTGHYKEENMKVTFVPNRNSIFCNIILGYALSLPKSNGSDIRDVFMGVHSGDHEIYPDCRAEFFDSLIRTFQFGNWESWKVNIKTPYIETDKEGILRDCLKNCEELGLDFDVILKNTLTSYSPNKKGESSGLTGSDIERIEAFIKIGRKDPIKYEKDWGFIVEQAKKILEGGVNG